MAEALEARQLLSVTLLKDVATTPEQQPVVQFGGSAYFVASDPAHGYELWKTDGTAAGTAIVRDINPGPGSSGVTGLTVADGRLYFAASDGTHGSELWTTDGTAAGTTMVADISPGADGSGPAMITPFNGKLYFAAADPAHGREIWTSDGTAAGTMLAVDANPGTAGCTFSDIVTAGTKLYFATRTPGAKAAVWVTDGTQAGTLMLTTDYINVTKLTVLGTTVCFTGINSQLWKTNGTVAGTGLVIDPSPGASGSVNAQVVVGGVFYFVAYNLSSGGELWRSDGTNAGTYMLKDINPGTGSGIYYPPSFANVNGTLYFKATDGVHGDELWKTDGTAAGTVLVKDIYTGSSNSWLTNLTNVNGTLYFQATDGTYGLELWKSDGTVAGTVRISDVAAGYQDASPYGMTAVGSAVVFMASTGAGGGAVFRTDGSLAGTVKVRDLQLPSEGSDVHDLAVMGNDVYFMASPGGNREQLWKSDGTPAGTTLVADVNPWYHESWTYLTAMAGKLYFAGADTVGGVELWVSDGTPDGTYMLKDVRAGYGWSEPESLTVVGNTLYFTATDGVNGRELWKTDGTAAGTVMVKDIHPGSADANIANLVAVGGVLYFTADDGSHGVELWRSGGTAASTWIVSDIQAGAGSSAPSLLTANGSTLYFFADDGAHGRELWKSNAFGTSLVKDILPGASGSVSTVTGSMVAFGGAVYFAASNGQTGEELWKSDGTSAGTALVMDIRPGSGGSSVRGLTPFNGKLAFEADGPGGLPDTVWLTDGTAAGTAPAYPVGTAPEPYWYEMSVLGDNLYFWADDGGTGYGREVWRTDGTQAGTMLVKDVNPGTSSANYGGFNYIVIAGNVAFFVADDGETGYELWAAALPAPSIAPASVQEGGTVTLSADDAGPATNAGGPVTYVWDLDQDGVFGETGADATRGDEVGATPTFSAAGLDGPSTFPIAVRATDSAGTTTAQGSVTVANAVPTPSIDPIPSSGTAEGSTLHITGSTADPSPADFAAGLTLQWAVKRNGATLATRTTTATTADGIDFQPPDNGDYVVSLTATDKDGGVTTTSATFHVDNVAPTATLADSAAAAGVPALVQLAGASDPSPADSAAGLQYAFDLDDDGVFEVTSAAPWTTTTFMTTGTHTVRARVRDKDGGENIYAATVNVSLPAGPAASLTSGGAVDEGSAGAVSFAGAVGAGPFTYSYDFDNDGTFEVAGSASPAAVVPAGYLADGPFTRTVRGRVTDLFGQSTDYTADILVRNVAPTLVIPAAANGLVVLGTGYVLSLAATDPGSDHVSHWHVDWGDGGASDAGAASGLFAHTYAAAGTFAVTATATDDDGSYAATAHVTVTAAPPTAGLAAGSMAADGSAYQFTVIYDDDLGVDAATIGDGDFEVTGPAGTAAARLVSYAPDAADGGGHGGVAMYEVPSPLGTWSWQDNGGYTVMARPGAVRDLQGIDLPAGQVGGFDVALPAPVAPDLAVQFAGPVPKSVAPNGKYSVTLKLSNHGGRSLPATGVTTRLFLSSDKTLDDGDLLLGSAAGKVALPINGSSSVKVAFASPKAQASGRYYVLAVADATGAVAERDERNNVTAASAAVTVTAPTVDLSTAFAAKPKPSYQPGDRLTVGVRVTNAGNAAAAGRATLRLYFSADAILDDGDLSVATSVLSLKLKAKGSAVFNRTLKVPASLAGRKWYVFASTDGTAVGDHHASNDVARTGPFTVAGK